MDAERKEWRDAIAEEERMTDESLATDYAREYKIHIFEREQSDADAIEDIPL